MKKMVLLEFLLFSFLCSAVAQDTIKTKNGQDILSKVIEISNSEIKYKKINNQEGPTYILNKSEVLSIRYQNGDIEVFSENDSYSEKAKKTNARIPVNAGMKYKEYQNLYNHRKYIPQIGDPYNPTLAGITSFLIPGLGQGLCDEWGRGTLYFVTNLLGSTATYLWFSSYLRNASKLNASMFIMMATVTLASDIMSIVDAVQVAKIKNMYYQDIRGKQSNINIGISPFLTCTNIPESIVPALGLSFNLNY